MGVQVPPLAPIECGMWIADCGLRNDICDELYSHNIIFTITQRKLFFTLKLSTLKIKAATYEISR